MRLIDADRLLSDKMKSKYYHLPNGDVAIPIVDIEHAPTVSGWISVKDRLPESAGLKVIVCAKTVQESVLQTKAVFVAFRGYGDGKWYTPDVDFMASAKTMNDHVHPVWEITHWMPLPTSPKGWEDENV